MKLSEIIEAAVRNPQYLNVDLQFDYLCIVVEVMADRGVITQYESDHVREAIQEKIDSVVEPEFKGTYTLGAMLNAVGPDEVRGAGIYSEINMHYRRIFWAVWCMDLVREGK